MAISTTTELQAVASVATKLQAAFEHARSIKATTTVDPPLPISSLESDIETLQHGIDEKYDQNYRFAAVETAARDAFYSIISSTKIEDPAFVDVWNLLDILLVAGDKGKCAPELVVWLVEELLDSQTTEGCRVVFDYLESRRERLAQKDFHKKNLVFLRACNELLRRLSRAEDASFCGRVFFFLFQTFPLGDKSSVNLRGEFHIENTTSFDETATSTPSISGSQAPAASNAAPKPAKPGVKSTKTPEEGVLDDATLYTIFWRLQQVFSVPTKLFKPADFQDFKAALLATMTKFKKTPTVVKSSTIPQQDRISRQDDAVEDADFSENYNPKYLTSKDLFGLELTDQAFQRHIFVQALILLDFLLSLTEKAKQTLQRIEHPNKSMLYDFTLDAEDAVWVLDTKRTIREIFQLTPEGRFYDRMVDTILVRDRNWVRWKIESCPSIVRGVMAIEEITDVRSKVMRLSKPRRLEMRATDLSFLEDDESGGLNALLTDDRFTAPTVGQLLDGIKTDGLDLDFAGDDEKVSLQNMIQNKTWRLVREARTSRLDTLELYENDNDINDIFGSKLPDDEAEAEAVELAA